jgi:hypothetical protein
MEQESGERHTDVPSVQPHHAQTVRTRRPLAMTPSAWNKSSSSTNDHMGIPNASTFTFLPVLFFAPNSFPL